MEKDKKERFQLGIEGLLKENTRHALLSNQRKGSLTAFIAKVSPSDFAFLSLFLEAVHAPSAEVFPKNGDRNFSTRAQTKVETA